MASYRGEVTLRDRVRRTRSTRFPCSCCRRSASERVIAMAKSLGVESKLPAKPDLALGWAEVTLLEMTRAMDAIATDNKSIEPYTVRAIRAPRRRPLYTRPETVADPPDWNRLDDDAAARSRRDRGNRQGGAARPTGAPPARPGRPTTIATPGLSGSPPTSSSGFGSATTTTARWTRSRAAISRPGSGAISLSRRRKSRPSRPLPPTVGSSAKPATQAKPMKAAAAGR